MVTTRPAPAARRTRKVKRRTLTLRTTQQRALESAARAWEIGPAKLAGVLLTYGLDLLADGDPGIQRAVRTSRDG